MNSVGGIIRSFKVVKFQHPKLSYQISKSLKKIKKTFGNRETDFSGSSTLADIYVQRRKKIMLCSFKTKNQNMSSKSSVRRKEAHSRPSVLETLGWASDHNEFSWCNQESQGEFPSWLSKQDTDNVFLKRHQWDTYFSLVKETLRYMENGIGF